MLFRNSNASLGLKGQYEPWFCKCHANKDQQTAFLLSFCFNVIGCCNRDFTWKKSIFFPFIISFYRIYDSSGFRISAAKISGCFSGWAFVSRTADPWSVSSPLLHSMWGVDKQSSELSNQVSSLAANLRWTATASVCLCCVMTLSVSWSLGRGVTLIMSSTFCIRATDCNSVRKPL